MTLNDESLMLIGGICAFVLTLHWVRNKELREKYAITWMAVAALLLACGLFPELIKSTSHAVHLSYPALVLFVALSMIYAFAFTVSVSLTRLYRRNVQLLQEIGLLEERLRTLENTAAKH